MTKTLKKTLAAAAVAGPLALMASTALAVPVGLELTLVIDVSGSVDATEYALQRTGYVNAFNNAGIQAAIATITGGVAVNVIQFSSSAVQSIAPTLLTNAADASAFATVLSGMARSGAVGTQTDIATAINLARTNLNVAPGAGTFEGVRRVIDVSGDGSQNENPCGVGTSDACLDQARLDTQALGIVINGLAIGGIDAYYTAHVVSAGGFLESAATFADFSDAVTRKIGREIRDVPAPATLAIFGASLLALVGLRRKA